MSVKRQVVTMRRGQTMLEYVLAFFLLALVSGVVVYLVSASRESSNRARALICSDCP